MFGLLVGLRPETRPKVRGRHPSLGEAGYVRPRLLGPELQAALDRPLQQRVAQLDGPARRVVHDFVVGLPSEQFLEDAAHVLDVLAGHGAVVDVDPERGGDDVLGPPILPVFGLEIGRKRRF